ncbi:MAG: 50S ribosomal protein L30 [Candidatus Firestonebacteria bacterium]|nr:50S ribosomal protein L30 [Candidatus Firestonebacteria bacterium]
MDRKIKVTLVKSIIGTKENHKKTIKSLGLRKISSSKIHTATPQILGMIKLVEYLVKVEEII